MLPFWIVVRVKLIDEKSTERITTPVINLVMKESEKKGRRDGKRKEGEGRSNLVGLFQKLIG